MAAVVPITGSQCTFPSIRRSPDVARTVLERCAAHVRKIHELASIFEANRRSSKDMANASTAAPRARFNSKLNESNCLTVTTALTEDEEDHELARDLFYKVGGVLCPEGEEGGGGILSLPALRRTVEQAQTKAEQTLLEAISERLCRIVDHVACDGNANPREPEVSFQDFLQVFRDVPRIRGERLRWAGSLGIEATLARLLPRGDAFDGLRGLRNLSPKDAEALANKVSGRLAAELPGLLQNGLKRLSNPSLSELQMQPQLQERGNSKFLADGLTVGRFATLADFYRGPEALIGVPNPQIYKGMHKEHCIRDNADRTFTSTNYNVTTCPRDEWEAVVDPIPGKTYPHTPWDKEKWPTGCNWWGEHGRQLVSVDELLKRPTCMLRWLMRSCERKRSSGFDCTQDRCSCYTTLRSVDCRSEISCV